MGEQLFVEQTADNHLVRLSHSASLHTLQLGGMQPQIVAIDALLCDTDKEEATWG